MQIWDSTKKKWVGPIMCVREGQQDKRYSPSTLCMKSVLRITPRMGDRWVKHKGKVKLELSLKSIAAEDPVAVYTERYNLYLLPIK